MKTTKTANHKTPDDFSWIEKGIKEEFENDVRMHAGMKHETFTTLMKYLRSENDDIMRTACSNALDNCVHFWKIYFVKGEEPAAEYISQLNEEIRKSTARVKDMIADANKRA